MSAYTPQRRHRGESLISLMIGLLISTLTIAGMLVLYKAMVQVSGNASRTAIRDGQASAALTAVQMDLQSAGFGVPATDPLATKLAVLSGDTAVVWRSKPNLDPTTGFQCTGLYLDSGKSLYRLDPLPCTTVAGLTLGNWDADSRELVAGPSAFYVPTQDDGSAQAEVGALSLTGSFTFQLGTPRQCLPYMQQNFATTPTAAPAQQVVLAHADGSGVIFSACLPNLTT